MDDPILTASICNPWKNLSLYKGLSKFVILLTAMCDGGIHISIQDDDYYILLRQQHLISSLHYNYNEFCYNKSPVSL